MTAVYKTGQITLANGSAVVTGVGTAWATMLIAGGIIFPVVGGNPLAIQEVVSNTAITAEKPWAGVSGTYDYVLVRWSADEEQNSVNSSILATIYAELQAGSLWKYDVAGSTADRAIYNERPKGFSYLVIDTNPAQLYIKASATSADWAGPFTYATGPTGPAGPAGYVNLRGAYSGVTAYAKNDGVLYNGSSFVALQATTGNAPPTLPATSNAYWQLLAIKGTDGAGTGDVVGPAGATDDMPAFFDGTTGKLLKVKTKSAFKTWLALAAAETSFDNTTANLSGSPATVQAAINALAANSGGGKNDALFAIEIADLKGVKMGMVGGVADSFDDETGIATKTNAAYDAANDWYSPTDLVGTSAISFTADSDASITTTRSYRLKYGSAGLAASGTYIRVQLTGPVSGPAKQISNVFFGRAAAAGNAWDMDAASITPVRLTFGGSNTVTPPVGGTVWSDWVAFSLDNTKDHIVAIDMIATTGSLRFRNSTYANTATYYKDSGTAEAGTPVVSGYTVGSGFTAFATGIEVKSTAATVNNMTLVSIAYTASSVPSTARIAVLLADALALTPGTDFTMEVSRDNGTTWTSVTLTLTMPLFGGVKMYEGTTSLTGQPSGLSMKWRAKSLTNKSVIMSGVVLQQS